MITPDGIIARVVVGGSLAFAGDGGPAISTAVKIGTPYSEYVDTTGGLYFTDAGTFLLVMLCLQEFLLLLLEGEV
jgi:hypothetical protein